MAAAVAVVTDSTSCLSADLVADSGIRVVPLRVTAGGVVSDDGPAALSGALEAELRRGARLSTASPAPAAFIAAYAAAAAAGAEAVVSVHLSAGLSGTVSSATLAAASATMPRPIPSERESITRTGTGARAAASVAELTVPDRPADR